MPPKNPQDMTFAEQIALVRTTDIGVPRRLDIDLAVVGVDALYSISGNLFYVVAAPDGDSYIDVRFNKQNQAMHRLFAQMGFVTPFHTVYITTPADQTGTLTIIYGTEAPGLLQMIDNRSATSADLAQIRAELQGDVAPENWGAEFTVGGAAVEIIGANANRKGCIIQAKSTNDGIVYIGFSNAVDTDEWISELQPGMSFSIDDYRGDLWAIGSAAGQLVGWGEW